MVNLGLRLTAAVCSHVSATTVSKTYTKLKITLSPKPSTYSYHGISYVCLYKTGTVCKKCIA